MTRSKLSALVLGSVVLCAGALVSCAAREAAMSPNAKMLQMYRLQFASRAGEVEALSSKDPDIVMEALNVLQARHDPAGQAVAEKLLNSKNSYIWLNAALYLGALRDHKAIPYLIRTLSHQAMSSHQEAAADLKAMTGRDFGPIYALWAQWWRDTQGGPADLVARVRSGEPWRRPLPGEQYWVSGALDPLTIECAGDQPVALAGIRPKNGLEWSKAMSLLNTAVAGQWVELVPDVWPPQDRYGKLNAYVYWVRSGGMDADNLRRGIPPVPFASRTLVNRYLLESGYYELDKTAAHDPSMRKELTSASAGPAVAKALDNTALHYYNGRGVAVDRAEAAKWFREAADQGDSRAQYALGRMCADGEGVHQDYKQAVRWFRRAAEQGNADGMNGLAAILVWDAGLADPAQGLKWAKKAVKAEPSNPYFRETLGAAYAANGEFDMAVKTERDALRTATEPKLRQQIKGMIGAFQKRMTAIGYRKCMEKQSGSGNVSN